MRIEIRRQSPDGLSEQLWVFLQFELSIVLNEYHALTRATKRHKFTSTPEASYDRHSRERRFTPDPRMEEKDVPMPEDVLQEAKQIVISKIRIGRFETELGKSLH